MDRDRHARKHVEMERLFGADFVPIVRTKPGAKPAAPGRPAPARPAAAEPPEWTAFREQVLACTKCDELCAKRTQVVFGVGTISAPIVFVGEAPGEDEDRQGEPFVGRAGQLLTKTLKKLGVRREQVYIANILKCRPPGNRTPKLEEMTNCMPYLLKQLQFIKPKFICGMGNVAIQTLLGTKIGITQMRGKYHEWNGMKIFATFHPAYILRNMNDLGIFETDLRKVCGDAGLIA
jgi:DNA polymerase